MPLAADDNFVVPRYLFSAVIACLAAACGSDNGGLTQPTPSALPPSVVFFVHNTLNPLDNRASLDVAGSWDGPYVPILFSLRPWAWDDFTSATSTTIRAVSWQGGYCDRKGPGLPPPVGPPRPTSSTFQLSFLRDSNGRPQEFAQANPLTFTSAEAHEQWAFDSDRSDAYCAYYDYAAVLSTPLPVTAGTRYWLLIRAYIGAADSPWGWRIGQQDNSISAQGALNGGLFTVAKDLAFSLSDQ